MIPFFKKNRSTKYYSYAFNFFFNALITLLKCWQISDEVETYNPDDSDPNWQPSKLQMAKNMAIYLAKNFVNDVKSYIKSYPVVIVSQFICHCGWVLPLYALYKKTGIDVPAKISNFMMGHENLAIFGRNLYNVIPMTLASFLYKWGREAYSYMKN